MDKQTIAWNAEAKEAFGTESGNIIAITFSTKGHDSSEMKISKTSLKDGDSQKKDLTSTLETGTNKGDNFIYFSTINNESKGFVIYFDWDGDGEDDVTYKFVIPGSELTFDSAEN